MIISQDPPKADDSTVSDPRKQATRVDSKLIAEVKQVTQSDSISKKGYLMYQENAVEDKWAKKWFVIRRYVWLPFKKIASAQ
jgi:kinesin family protein 1